MNYRILLSFAVVNLLRVLAQESSHEGPAELRNNSVHVLIRADTLIDRTIVDPNRRDQLLQHIHKNTHTLQIIKPHHRHIHPTVVLNPEDELHFRLTGKRRFFGLFPGPFIGFMTMKVDSSRTDIGEHVAGHIAIANEAKRKEGAIIDKITDKAEFHWVWAYLAPAGYQFEPVGGTDQDVKTKIQKVAAKTNHNDGKEKAKKIGLIEYVARPTGGKPEAFIDRMFVVAAGGNPSGVGTRIKVGTRLRLCENEKTGNGPIVVNCKL